MQLCLPTCHWLDTGWTFRLQTHKWRSQSSEHQPTIFSEWSMTETNKTRRYGSWILWCPRELSQSCWISILYNANWPLLEIHCGLFWSGVLARSRCISFPNVPTNCDLCVSVGCEVLCTVMTMKKYALGGRRAKYQWPKTPNAMSDNIDCVESSKEDQYARCTCVCRQST